MDTNIKTLTIVKRGRKYFECKLGKYTVKLVINDVSKFLQEKRAVKVEVKDISQVSSFGTNIKFEPLVILEEWDPEERQKEYERYRDAEYMLKGAEAAAKDGKKESWYYERAFNFCSGLTAFDERIFSLKKMIDANINATPEETAATEARVNAESLLTRVDERLEKGDFEFVISSIEKCSVYEHLSSRLAMAKAKTLERVASYSMKLIDIRKMYEDEKEERVKQLELIEKQINDMKLKENADFQGAQ